jgi:dTDP-4-dehydrorhamnose 3,5-epimerase
MIIKKTEFEGLYVILTRIHKDERGYLFESYTREEYHKNIPELILHNFDHELVSVSQKDIFRGLHLQIEPYGQGKLCQVLNGEVIDVVVDLRKGSKKYGQYYMAALNNEIHEGYQRQLWIPPGFAHGFLSLQDNTVFHYKCTFPRIPKAERTLHVGDADLKLPWKFKDFIMSEKDKNGMSLIEYEREQNEEI